MEADFQGSMLHSKEGTIIIPCITFQYVKRSQKNHSVKSKLSTGIFFLSFMITLILYKGALSQRFCSICWPKQLK